MRSSACKYGPGDPAIWAPCAGHPGDPRTPDHFPEYDDIYDDPHFQGLVQKNLLHIEDNVCGELSTKETSNGVTDAVLPHFSALIAGLPEEQMRALMMFAVWGAEEMAVRDILLEVLDRASRRRAEEMAESQY